MKEVAAIGLLALAGLLVFGERIMRRTTRPGFQQIVFTNTGRGPFITLDQDDAPIFSTLPVPTVAERLQNMSEREVVARTAWGEARGVTPDHTDLAAVMAVIRNRARRSQWPSTPKAVALQPNQFSVWFEDNPNRDRTLAVTAADRDYAAALAMYDAIFLRGDLSQVPVAARTADHYHTTGVSPYWRHAMKETGRQGDHIFYTT